MSCNFETMASSSRAEGDHDALKRNRCDYEIEEINFSNRHLLKLEDLGCYKNLHFLWLNNNKLSSLSFLSHNYRLSELYLHDNRLSNVGGALSHLVSLCVLFLHNNQLRCLPEVLYELRHMTGLRQLTLYGNPVCTLPDYRSTVIFYVPSLQTLDRSDVGVKEKQLAVKHCDKTTASVMERIAFGRTTFGIPEVSSAVPRPLQHFQSHDIVSVCDNYYTSRIQHASIDEATEAKIKRRSPMLYKTIDWSAVLSTRDRWHRPHTSGSLLHSPSITFEYH